MAIKEIIKNVSVVLFMGLRVKNCLINTVLLIAISVAWFVTWPQQFVVAEVAVVS